MFHSTIHGSVLCLPDGTIPYDCCCGESGIPPVIMCLVHNGTAYNNSYFAAEDSWGIARAAWEAGHVDYRSTRFGCYSTAGSLITNPTPPVSYGLMPPGATAPTDMTVELIGQANVDGLGNGHPTLMDLVNAFNVLYSGAPEGTPLLLLVDYLLYDFAGLEFGAVIDEFISSIVGISVTKVIFGYSEDDTWLDEMINAGVNS